MDDAVVGKLESAISQLERVHKRLCDYGIEDFKLLRMLFKMRSTENCLNELHVRDTTMKLGVFLRKSNQVGHQQAFKDLHVSGLDAVDGLPPVIRS